MRITTFERSRPPPARGTGQAKHRLGNANGAVRHLLVVAIWSSRNDDRGLLAPAWPPGATPLPIFGPEELLVSGSAGDDAHAWPGRLDMAYRNKTYIAFDGDDIVHYRLMCAWKAHDKIDFDFHDAHVLNTARDTSKPETIKERLRERLANTKQAIVLVSDTTRECAGRSTTFLHYECQVIRSLDLPVVFVNLNGSRRAQSAKLPALLTERYSVSVPFGSKIVRYALDNFPEDYAANRSANPTKSGPYHYLASVYTGLGL